MRIPVQLLVQGEAEITDLIREGELGPINVKVFLYHNFVLPVKQDDLCFHRGELEAIILAPLDCHINGGLGEDNVKSVYIIPMFGANPCSILNRYTMMNLSRLLSTLYNLSNFSLTQ